MILPASAVKFRQISKKFAAGRSPKATQSKAKSCQSSEGEKRQIKRLKCLSTGPVLRALYAFDKSQTNSHSKHLNLSAISSILFSELGPQIKHPFDEFPALFRELLVTS